jgi:hypothetical protein
MWAFPQFSPRFLDLVAARPLLVVAADALKKLRPKLKVLLRTGYSRNAVVHRGRIDAGVDLIQKPLTRATPASRIRSLMDDTAETPEAAPAWPARPPDGFAFFDYSQERWTPCAAISSAMRLRAWKTRVFTVFCGTPMICATSSIDCSW